MSLETSNNINKNLTLYLKKSGWKKLFNLII